MISHSGVVISRTLISVPVPLPLERINIALIFPLYQSVSETVTLSSFLHFCQISDIFFLCLNFVISMFSSSQDRCFVNRLIFSTVTWIGVVNSTFSHHVTPFRPIAFVYFTSVYNLTFRIDAGYIMYSMSTTFVVT